MLFFEKDFAVGSQHGSFKAWLLNLTRWRITDQFRKRPPPARQLAIATNDTAHTATVDQIADPASLDLDAVWNHDWEQNLVEAAMERVQSQVSPAHFQLFHLHVVKQWTARKVAQKLGTKLSQVYFAKYKISRLIRREVKRLEAELF